MAANERTSRVRAVRCCGGQPDTRKPVSARRVGGRGGCSQASVLRRKCSCARRGLHGRADTLHGMRGAGADRGALSRCATREPLWPQSSRRREELGLQVGRYSREVDFRRSRAALAGPVDVKPEWRAFQAWESRPALTLLKYAGFCGGARTGRLNTRLHDVYKLARASLTIARARCCIPRVRDTRTAACETPRV